MYFTIWDLATGNFPNKLIIIIIITIISFSSRFIFRRPALSSISNLFRLPFSNSVWLGSFILFTFLVLILYPAMKNEWIQSSEEIREDFNEPSLPSISDDVLVIIGAVSQQGSIKNNNAIE